jgi:energy-converting hydrogenase Eha subunit A
MFLFLFKKSIYYPTPILTLGKKIKIIQSHLKIVGFIIIGYK